MGADMNVTIRTHYAKDDPQCQFDYHSVDVVIGGVVVQSYGSYYDDKGRDKVDGFLDALRMLGRLNNLAHENVADSDL